MSRRPRSTFPLVALAVFAILAALVSYAPLAIGAQPEGRVAGKSSQAAPAAVSSATLFLPAAGNTMEAVVQVDATGRVHAAYSPASGDDNGTYWAHYAECAGDCDNAANWHGAAVGEVGPFGGYVRLALDPQGRPRMMWYRLSSTWDDGTYVYATCNSDCTDPTHWSETDVVSSPTSPDGRRFFALDPQGRPRFLYTDTSSGHSGTFYAFCDNDCTSIDPQSGRADNWWEGVFHPSYLLYDFLLTFNSAGGPRLAYTVSSSQRSLLYAECDNTCYDGDNWRQTTLPVAAETAYSFSLRLDSSGRPRLGFYSGYTGDEQYDRRLYYLYCQSGCTTSSNWKALDLGLAAYSGLSVDLAIDSQNRPHLAYYVDADPFGLQYAECTSNCESTAANWQVQWIETSEQLTASNPVPTELGCSISVWFAGMKPSVALDGQGNPHFGYDAEHTQGGTCTAHTDIELVRYAQLGSSGPPATLTQIPTRAPTRTPAAPPPLTPVSGRYRALLPIVRR